MKITLRFTLSTVVAALTVFTSLSIFLISYVGSMQSLLQLTENMTDEVAKGIIEKTRTLFDSAERANAQLAFLIQSGILNPRDGEALMKTAAAWITDNEGFTSVDIGVPNGDKYKAERMPDDSISMRSYIRDAKNVRMNWRHTNPDYDHDPEFQNTVKDLAKGYDARTRPWWIAAVTKGATSWTDMYVSALRKQFVYSCVTPVYDAKKQLLAVASIDINVVTLSEFLASLHILEHGRAFILNDKKQVIALPFQDGVGLSQLVRKNPTNKDNPYELYPLEDLPDTTIRQAIELSMLKRATNGNADSFEFTTKDGLSTICRMMDFPYKSGVNFTIGIIVPKDDVMASVNERSRYILLGIIAFTVVAVVIGMAISRTMSRSLTVLAGEVDKVGRLDLTSDTQVKSRLLEVHNISSAVARMRNSLRSFKKYVPADLVVHLNEQRKEAVLEGERREITTFFSDIAEFTNISEELSAEVLVENLGVYFDGLSSVIHSHKGTLDKYIGDSVMAFWGAPALCDNHAALACDAALACQDFLEQLRRQFEHSGQPVFKTRIGIHTGEVIVGNIGSPTRMNYTVIGDNVNLASRLEGLNKLYGTRIIVSDACYARLGGAFATRRLDIVAVKGKAQGVGVRELLGRVGTVEAGRLAGAALYESGLELYLARQWSQAASVFEDVLAGSGGTDLAARLMAGRCQVCLASPPPEDWSGVYHVTSK
jgi:adenylate cyclase